MDSISPPGAVGLPPPIETIEIDSAPPAPPRASHGPISSVAGAVLAAVLGFAIRVPHVFRADFPLADGGLFAVMIEAVRSNAYGLPWSVRYNGIDIPFAYPPLGFYIAAALADLTHTDALVVLRLLPLALDSLAILAFAALASAALGSRVAAFAATLAFAVMPGSYLWLIMGGGLTRSLGFLFALLALNEAWRYYTSPVNRFPARLALFAGLTLLSHPAMSVFLAFSGLMLLLAFGRTRSRFTGSLLAVIGAVAIASPWWVLLLARYGVTPLVAASQTGSLLSYATVDTGVGEAGVLVVAIVVAIVAFYLMAMSRDLKFLLFGWLGLIFFLDFRESLWLVTVPIALGFGLVVAAIAGSVQTRLGLKRPRPSRVGARSRFANAVASGVVLLIVGFIGHRISVGFQSLVPVMLRPLSIEERAAMRWIAEKSPAESRFLVVTGDLWAANRSAEWFPVLTNRISVATPQGKEWIPGSDFLRRANEDTDLQQCGAQDAACIDEWRRTTQAAFSHVYVRKRADPSCCEPLRLSLLSDSRYTMVYDGPGATVFGGPRSVHSVAVSGE